MSITYGTSPDKSFMTRLSFNRETQTLPYLLCLQFKNMDKKKLNEPIMRFWYSKTVLSGHSKTDKTKVLKTNGS